MKKKKAFLKMIKLLGLKRCKKTKLKPMGIRSTFYPPGYKAPKEIIHRDGSKEIVIDAETKIAMNEAWKKMGAESIKGRSLF